MEQAPDTVHHAGNVKTLVLVRHAKSSWEAHIPSDFERPLNERGKKDAPIMATRLKQKLPQMDALVTSPAKRARKTANYFAAVYGHQEEDVKLISKLYHADTDTFFEVAAALSDTYNHVTIFSHNPGISEFVNLLISDIRVDQMPTCGVFAIQVHTNSWRHFKKAGKSFLFFDYPKLVD